MLGTGLTTVDVIISLRAMGWMGSIHAISRHGWFPHSHFRGIEYPDFPPAGVDLADLGLEKLVALVQHHCALLYERNANPAIIGDKLRPHTQRIGATSRGMSDSPSPGGTPHDGTSSVTASHRISTRKSPARNSPDSFRFTLRVSKA